ncbi:MAG: hypothetical protein DHS20C14_07050 [Phycisphaeraceae bacterium]|nr:MAG: hypothetical protein DHS20C14_07050 [Phycisphaeraceae bacterium]
MKPFNLELTDSDRDEIRGAVARVLDSGHLMAGPETDASETALAEYIGVKHAVTVNSGTSAIEILLRAKDIAGAFSFFPTKVMTILEGGMITTDDDHFAGAHAGKAAGLWRVDSFRDRFVSSSTR